MMLFSSLLPLALCVPGVLSHGFVQQIRNVDTGEYFQTWNPYKDPQQSVTRITRRFDDNGPVTDGLYTGPNITCNIGGNIPTNITAKIPAGSKIEFLWTDWQSDHPGPVMTYMAYCGTAGCENFAGDTGNVWFKIDQSGYDATQSVPWASKRLPNQNSTWPVTIPKTILAGEYILRHEILGLQRAVKEGLAQFYPGCHQVTITGGGSAKPSGVALPGAYALDDPGILLEYRDVSATNTYTPPGGAVFVDA